MYTVGHGEYANLATITTYMTTSVGEQAAAFSDFSGNSKYPEEPTNGSKVLLRGDLALYVPQDETVTSTNGIIDDVVFSSLCGLPIPKDDDEKENFASRINCAGIIKNTMTDPVDKRVRMGYAPSHNVESVAIQVSGSFSVPYNGTDTVSLGDTMIWGFPDYNGNGFPGGRFGKSRPMPILSVLKPETLKNLIERVSRRMLKENASRTKGFWDIAAEQRKRSLLTHVTAGTLVLAKRGIVDVISSEDSYLAAAKNKFTLTAEALTATSITTTFTSTVFHANMVAAQKIFAREKEIAKSKSGIGKTYFYDGDGTYDAARVAGDNIIENDAFSKNAQRVGPENQKSVKNNFLELARHLEVLSDDYDRNVYFESNHLRKDILKLISSKIIPDAELQALLNFTEESMGLDSDENSPMVEFKARLKENLGSDEAGRYKLQKELEKRIVGVAISRVGGSKLSPEVGEFQNELLDLNVGSRYL